MAEMESCLKEKATSKEGESQFEEFQKNIRLLEDTVKKLKKENQLLKDTAVASLEKKVHKLCTTAQLLVHVHVHVSVLLLLICCCVCVVVFVYFHCM